MAQPRRHERPTARPVPDCAKREAGEHERARAGSEWNKCGTGASALQVPEYAYRTGLAAVGGAHLMPNRLHEVVPLLGSEAGHRHRGEHRADAIVKQHESRLADVDALDRKQMALEEALYTDTYTVRLHLHYTHTGALHC